jgi:hypothetical protein
MHLDARLLQPVRVGGLTFRRRIGVHDLEHGSSRLRVEGFIGHRQCCARRQYSIDSGRETGRHFDSGNRVRIYLGTLPMCPGTPILNQLNLLGSGT